MLNYTAVSVGYWYTVRRQINSLTSKLFFVCIAVQTQN